MVKPLCRLDPCNHTLYIIYVVFICPALLVWQAAELHYHRGVNLRILWQSVNLRAAKALILMRDANEHLNGPHSFI